MSDSLLIESYRQTENNIYISEIFERYNHLVYGVCLKYLSNRDYAQDAVIQIFEKLLSDLSNHEIHNFSSWLHSVSRNHCLMILRKKKQNLRQEEKYKAEMWIVSDEEDLDNIRLTDYQLELLEKAIPKLKPEQKKCVELFYLEEKCYKEIELLTGYPLKKVKSYIQNGKRNLKIIMEEADNVRKKEKLI